MGPMDPVETAPSAPAPSVLSTEAVIADVERIRQEVPGASIHGHMRIATAGRIRDVYLGSINHITATTALIDWQQSPLAEVFLTCDPGSDYEIAVGDGAVSGLLVARHLFEWRQSQLVRVEGTAGSVVRTPEGWQPAERFQTPRLDAGPPVPGGRVTKLEVELDPAQMRVVERPAGEPLLILGEAGFGKTTVALRRLLHLRRQAGRGIHTAVIVPTESLRRLLEVMLQRSLAKDPGPLPEVFTFDGWAARAAYRAFPSLPRRHSTEAGAGVIALKRHRALREVLPQIARRTRQRVGHHDLHHLFGDQLLMERVSEISGRSITLNMVKEVLEHTRIQYSQTSEMSFRHVDAERRTALDGRPLDEGTSMADASTIDVEDHAVLFELDRLRSEAFGTPPAPVPTYDVIVLDEAQELAPIELSLIGRALRGRGLAGGGR